MRLRHDVWATRPIANDQALFLKGVEPAVHRPPPPSTMEEFGILDDVIEMLGGGIGHRVKLVVSVGAADPEPP